eukprot:566188-Prymnesium_polylepis.1
MNLFQVHLKFRQLLLHLRGKAIRVNKWNMHDVDLVGHLIKLNANIFTRAPLSRQLLRLMDNAYGISMAVKEDK